MTDSIDRKRRGGATEEEKAKLRSLPQKNPSDRVELSDLPRWAKTAMVQKEVMGMTWEEAAKLHGRTAATLSMYAKTPAGHKWRDRLQQLADDPVAMAEAYLRGNALNITLDRVAFLEMAKAAGDFAEADKIARDIQDRIPELAKKSAPKLGMSGGILQIVLPGGAGGSLEPLMVSTEYKMIEAPEEAEYEVLDD